MLTAAVVEGNYDVVFKALALLSHSEIMMTAVADTLANRETKRPGHHKIESLYRRTVEKVNTLSELHQCSRGNDSEKAVVCCGRVFHLLVSLFRLLSTSVLTLMLKEPMTKLHL